MISKISHVSEFFNLLEVWNELFENFYESLSFRFLMILNEAFLQNTLT